MHQLLAGGDGIGRAGGVERGAATADTGPLGQIILGIKEVATDHIIQPAGDLASRAQLLAPLGVVLAAQHVVEAGGGEVLRLILVAVPPTGDRGQLDAVQIEVHLQGGGGRVIIAMGGRVRHIVEVGRLGGDAVKRVGAVGQADIYGRERGDHVLDG